MKINWKGSLVALITPFDENLEVNYTKLQELLKWHLDNGTDGIVICGTTGETPTLSTEEQLKVIDCTVKFINKRIPVIAGCGSNNTSHSLHLAIEASKIGADGLLLINPYYNKTNLEGMYQHFATVASAVQLPIMLYNVPSRTGVSIPLAVVERLAAIPNIVAIKDASGDFDYLLKLRSLIPNLAVFTGNDSQIVPSMALGGVGTVTVFGNAFPNVSAAICKYMLTGNLVKAQELQIKYADIIDKLFIETNPIPIKFVLNLLGFDVGGYRLPLTHLSESNQEVLKTALQKIK